MVKSSTFKCVKIVKKQLKSYSKQNVKLTSYNAKESLPQSHGLSTIGEHK